MANYKESSITGSEYTRCNNITISNPYGRVPTVHFLEERATMLGPDRMVFDPNGSIDMPFDQSKTVSLIDPYTNLPTGIQVTYGDIYVMLYSAYMNAAIERDNALANKIFMDPINSGEVASSDIVIPL